MSVLGSKGGRVTNRSFVDPDLAEGSIVELRKRIKEMEVENATLATKTRHSKAKYEQVAKSYEELQKQMDTTQFNTREEKKLFKKSAPKTPAELEMEADRKKKQELYNKICACGSMQPKFKGYCENCVKKLKNEYEKLLDWYGGLAERYEKNMKMITTKGTKDQLMERKLRSMERRLKEMEKDVEIHGTTDPVVHEEMLNSKMKVAQIKREIEMLREEEARELEDYRFKEQLAKEQLNQKASEEEAIASQVKEIKSKTMAYEKQINDKQSDLVAKKQLATG